MGRRGLLLPVLAALAGGACGRAGETRAVPQVALSPCHLTGGRSVEAIDAFCGTVQVFEDREKKTGRTIDLRVAVVKATGRKPLPDPVVLLAGGPGQAATEVYSVIAGSFGRINLLRDVVLVDQRGTGGSRPLSCPGLDVDVATDDPDEARTPRARAAACAKELDADLRQYTTKVAMDDLDEVREKLGYPKVNLVGVSYGTRAALVYMKRHPERVRTAVLDGVVPTDWVLGRTAGKDAQGSLDRIFALCAEDAACAAAFPGLSASLAAVLGAEKQTLVIPHPVTAEPKRLTVTRASVASTLRALSELSDTAKLLPLLVHTAAREKDLRALAAQSVLAERLGGTISVGMHLAVTCSEDAPFLDRADVERENGASYLGSDSAAFYLEACKAWPRADVSAEDRAPLASDTPVLLLSGELDPVAPEENAESVAKTLKRSLRITVKGEGHGTLTRSCVSRIVADLIEKGDVAGLDSSCLADKAKTRFFTSFAGPPP
jgi:pimeloyl-ACP methyl ester carboxylesterase